MNNVSHYYGLGEGPLDRTADLFMGLECEIEDLANKPEVYNFTTTEDGSLRNNGLEFVSEPLPVFEIVSNFKNLHASLQFQGNGDPFSPRTSTHVHVNCRNLEMQQVKDILLYYALYEEYFFLMVSPERKNNIHCVPLNITILPKMYGFSFPKLVERWSKYTALNLLPLSRQGTIEFRHLQGTSDAILLENWLILIEKLFSWAKTNPVNKERLQDTHWIATGWKYLFGHVPTIMALEPTVLELTKNTLLDVKFAFVEK